MSSVRNISWISLTPNSFELSILTSTWNLFKPTSAWWCVTKDMVFYRFLPGHRVSVLMRAMNKLSAQNSTGHIGFVEGNTEIWCWRRYPLRVTGCSGEQRLSKFFIMLFVKPLEYTSTFIFGTFIMDLAHDQPLRGYHPNNGQLATKKFINSRILWFFPRCRNLNKTCDLTCVPPVPSWVRLDVVADIMRLDRLSAVFLRPIHNLGNISSISRIRSTMGALHSAFLSSTSWADRRKSHVCNTMLNYAAESGNIFCMSRVELYTFFISFLCLIFNRLTTQLLGYRSCSLPCIERDRVQTLFTNSALHADPYPHNLFRHFEQRNKCLPFKLQLGYRLLW